MVELDAGLAAQMAVAQQKLALSMMKQAADTQKQVADILAQTVVAGNNGKAVDLYA